MTDALTWIGLILGVCLLFGLLSALFEWAESGEERDEIAELERRLAAYGDRVPPYPLLDGEVDEVQAVREVDRILRAGRQ